MGKPRLAYYVGIGKDQPGLREVHRQAAYKAAPTAETTPQYSAVIGPFRTLQAAKFDVNFGVNNPHIQHVNDAERIAPQYAAELATLPERKVWY